MPDLDRTTSVSYTSGPESYVGSKVMKPGEIHYMQGEGGEVKEGEEKVQGGGGGGEEEEKEKEKEKEKEPKVTMF